MKLNIVLLSVIAATLFSCSSDKDNTQADQNSIIGSWDATELQINDETATDDEKNGRDILNFLTAQDCYILTFTFNEDLSAIVENSVNYLEINVNAGGTGLDIPCPTEKDTDTSTYTFDGAVLTYVDDMGANVSVNATISGNTMTLDASELDIPNFNSGGQLIFQRR